MYGVTTIEDLNAPPETEKKEEILSTAAL